MENVEAMQCLSTTGCASKVSVPRRRRGVSGLSIVSEHHARKSTDTNRCVVAPPHEASDDLQRIAGVTQSSSSLPRTVVDGLIYDPLDRPVERLRGRDGEPSGRDTRPPVATILSRILVFRVIRAGAMRLMGLTRTGPKKTKAARKCLRRNLIEQLSKLEAHR